MESLVGGLEPLPLSNHKDTHKTGGTDAFLVTDLLDAVARVNVAKSGTVVGTRRTLDFVPGAGISLTVADSAPNEKVTVQIDATAPAGAHNVLSTTHSDTAVTAGVNGSLLQYVTDHWAQKKSKRGTATVANNGTIAHGLGLTPSTVFITANAVQPYALAYEVNATNITVHHSAAGTLTVSYWAIE
jgi:Tfp pilus assembly protein PilZ